MSEFIQQQKITKYGVLIFTLGSLFYCYEFFIQVTPSVMVSELMRSFKINATLLSVMSGCFYGTYTIMQLPSGLILDRFGARITLTTVTLICAVGAMIFALTNSIVIALFARFLMGLGSGCAFVSALYLTIRWIPLRYFALFAGICQFLGSIGAVGGQAPLAMMLKFFTWRQTMFAIGIVGIVLAVFICLIVRDVPENKSNKNKLVKIPPPKMMDNLKEVLHNKQIWMIAVYSFAVWAPIVVFAAMWGVPFLATKYNFSNIVAANAVSVIWIGVALGSPLSGWLSDHLSSRLWFLRTFAVIGFVSIAAIIFTPLPVVLLYVLLFMVGISGSAQSLSFAVVTENSPRHTTSTANGFNNTAVVLGGVLFQPLIGILLDFYWQGGIQNGIRVYSLSAYSFAFLILPVCYIVALVMSIFFIKETNCLPFSDSGFCRNDGKVKRERHRKE